MTRRKLTILFVGVIMIFALAAGNVFAATDTVTRKEFAVLLAQSLELAKGKKEKCFKDLKLKDAETRFICILKKKRIFIGARVIKNISPARHECAPKPWRLFGEPVSPLSLRVFISFRRIPTMTAGSPAAS